jgi:thiopurine S-methyltransferase
MQKSFWESRWRKNHIGFHAPEPEADLAGFWGELSPEAGETVAVPLCGKSTDLVWLAGRHKRVFGIEFVEQACRDFFREQGEGIEVREEKFARGLTLSAEGITLCCADYMKLRPADVPDAALVYDRAALVALPPEIRGPYAEQTFRLFPRLRGMLVISFEYDETKMSGPPFSVRGDEIRNLYGSRFSIRRVSSTELIGKSEKYQSMGLESMMQTCWIMEA